ncbi:heme ABC transporter substrate-binding protein IsdE [Sporosarcina sp. YIM B06819]|uniref:heme ABC transporter substrate-binding protein IsdE n=1 Tax=Sporosarcina sp. YIM B06819 TaxID=3081769 RepID=UPI00298CA32B|nr:heme ABC transporter substrate-binding protein IsdE [Sporosarcina sp. YIM B06819]
MRKFNYMLCLLIVVIMAGCSSQDEAEVIDPTEDRIVATTVALTEIMDALELDLVGIPSSYKDLPKRYEGAKEVGNPMSPDMEMLLSLKPTEILSVTTLQYDLQEMFDERNIDMTYVDLESIDAMHSEILKLGEKYDRQAQAQAIVDQFEEKVVEIEQTVEGKEQPSVLILMGIPGSYLVATEHSYIGDLVKRSGGKNVITGEDVEFLSSNTEYLQQAKPDIILRAAHGMPDEVVKMFDDEFRTNDVWKHFEAVKNDRVYDLDELLFGTTGNLAAVEALDELQKMLYP